MNSNKKLTKDQMDNTKKLSLNLLSSAHKVAGTGPGSAWREFLKNFKNKPFVDEYEVFVNRKRDADIVHINSPDPRYKFQMRHGRYHGVVLHSVHFIPKTHTDNSFEPKNFLHRLFLKSILKWSYYFLKKSDELIVVNPLFIKDLINLGVAKDKITYIPNVVHNSEFHKVSAAQKAEFRKKHNFFPNDKIVVAVGQLQTRKGVKDFIEVAKDLPEVKFIWLGGFAFRKLSHGHKEIQEFLANPPANVFFKGRVQIKEVNEYLNLSNIFFMPALNELFPMSILEAANVGIPMLLRDLPEYAEIFSFTKYLKANNNTDFVNIIKTVFTNKAVASEAVKTSKAIAATYSADIIAKQWDEYYQRISHKYSERLSKRHAITAKSEAKKRFK